MKHTERENHCKRILCHDKQEKKTSVFFYAKCSPTTSDSKCSTMTESSKRSISAHSHTSTQGQALQTQAILILHAHMQCWGRQESTQMSHLSQLESRLQKKRAIQNGLLRTLASWWACPKSFSRDVICPLVLRSSKLRVLSITSFCSSRSFRHDSMRRALACSGQQSAPLDALSVKRRCSRADRRQPAEPYPDRTNPTNLIGPKPLVSVDEIVSVHMHGYIHTFSFVIPDLLQYHDLNETV